MKLVSLYIAHQIKNQQENPLQKEFPITEYKNSELSWSASTFSYYPSGFLTLAEGSGPLTESPLTGENAQAWHK